MNREFLRVNENGDLIIPKKIAEKYGLTPGAEALAEEADHTLVLHRAISCLSRVDIEVTNECNLSCKMCIRRTWQAPTGLMTKHTYRKVLDDLEDFNPRPTVFLGGFGEPLIHPHIVEFVKLAKEKNIRVELITNGTLLCKDTSTALIDAGLDFLWVSLDGATAQAYGQTRVTDNLQPVLDNLNQFVLTRYYKTINNMDLVGCCIPNLTGKPELGIAFVAGRKNIAELPEVVALARRLSVKKISVSNLLAYNQELKENILYKNSQECWQYGAMDLLLPPMDWGETYGGMFVELSSTDKRIPKTEGGNGSRQDVCPFIERGSMSIRWDGEVSPCWPLLYTHDYFIGDRLRRSIEYCTGSVLERSVREIWEDPAYLSFRKKVSEFQFSPCTQCNNCELADHNQEDCVGNIHPDCGGCLWAQGYIVCP